MPQPLTSLAQRLQGARAAWRGYRGAALGDDLVAACVVTVLLVPQSLAYAMLAGLPPVVGVMASLLPVLAYAAFGSSSTLAVGPVAVIAMMTAQAAAPVAQAHGITPALAAAVLAAEMALVFAAAVLLRLDVLAALLSAPVLHGFITGAAVVIALGQLPALLGLPVRGATAVELAQSALQADSAGALLPHLPTALVGLAALALLAGLRRWGARLARRLGVPASRAALAGRLAPMAVVAGAMAWIAQGPQAAVSGVALAGRIDLAQGLQFQPPWQAPWAVWAALAAPAVMLGLVAYVESLAVAEALGARRGERVRPQRELLGLAAANAAAACSGGMPVTGGFARSIVNFDAGARTRLAGVWTACGLALALLVFGDALRFLPKAVLAATIIVAVLGLLEAGAFVLAWRVARAEFALMCAVAALTVLAGVEPALLAGAFGSVALLLRATARPHWAEVGRLPGTEVFRNVRRFEVQTRPEVLAVRIDESLVFTNSRWLAETLLEQVLARPGLRHVVLMMSGVNGVDLTGLEALRQLAADLHGRGIRLHLSELKGPVADWLQAADLPGWLTGEVFRTQHEADTALATTAQAAR
ncbi:MAG: SulP family inorganic anion transporter [Rubrivivax sp.]